jgi:D-erythronate 2-dehydrogenase
VKVIITGGLGFLGLRLGRRLLERGELTAGDGGVAPIDALLLADVALPAHRADWMDSRVELAACDIADREQFCRLVDRDDLSVFHLAAVVSAQAERDLDLALQVNIDGGRNVLDAVRLREGRQRVVVTSTYATFGGALPDVCRDDTRLTPQSTYGMTKAILELLVADYTRRGLIDGRVARLPTVIIRPGAANAAASSVASAVFREPLAGRPYEVPVAGDTRMAVTGARTAVEGLIALHEADGAQLGTDRTVCFPSLSCSIQEMIESLHRACGDRALGPISWSPDPVVQAIVSSWPHLVEAHRATAIGVPPPDELDRIVRDAADELAAG